MNSLKSLTFVPAPPKTPIPIAKDLKAALKAWKSEAEGDYRKEYGFCWEKS
jgi:hypothetical protein